MNPEPRMPSNPTAAARSAPPAAVEVHPDEAQRTAQLLRSLVLGFGRLAGDRFVDSALALDTLQPSMHAALDRLLGEGWVAITVRAADGATLRIEETGFAGIWRVQRQEANGTHGARSIEAASLPADVPPALARLARLLAPASGAPDRVRGLLAELARRAQKVQPGSPAHTVNLTLGEWTPEELAILTERLGNGPVSGVCLGFTTTRFASTALANVWRVRYLDQNERLVLDTLEVVTFPECAAASNEAVRASVARLEQLAEQLGAQGVAA